MEFLLFTRRCVDQYRLGFPVSWLEAACAGSPVHGENSVDNVIKVVVTGDGPGRSRCPVMQYAAGSTFAGVDCIATVEDIVIITPMHHNLQNYSITNLPAG
jgi:hypothetical protein